MNYIGSKFRLLHSIKGVLRYHNVPYEGKALDLFSGTGAVAQLFKSIGYDTQANDWQYYSYSTLSAYLNFETLPRFETLFSHPFWRKAIHVVSDDQVQTYSFNNRRPLKRGFPAIKVIRFLNGLPGEEGAFYHEYCEGGREGRQYFSRENGLRLQAIRDQIHTWRLSQLIDYQEYLWLVASLLESADRVANTASIYGAYLKHVKRSARQPLKLLALRPVKSKVSPDRHTVSCQDSLEFVKTTPTKHYTLTYIDPPYNHRQYSSNYHILETLARWDLDDFVPRGKTGLRDPLYLKSKFCIKDKAYDAFDEMLAHVDSQFVLFSYNNEGTLSADQLSKLFHKNFSDVDFRKVNYQRYKADKDSSKRVYKADKTEEYLIFAKR